MATIRTKRSELLKGSPFALSTGEHHAIVIVRKQAVFIECADTLFRFNSAVLLPRPASSVSPTKPSALDVTLRALQYAGSHPTKTMFITGHTDSVGPDESNVRLSKLRAQAVYGLLMGKRDDFAEACWGPHLTQDQRYPPITYATNSSAMDDYRRRLVVPEDVSKTNARPSHGGVYAPI